MVQKNFIFENNKVKLFNLIKNISNFYGGDDKDFLLVYFEQMVMKNRDDMQKAIKCFEDLESQLKFMDRKPLKYEDTQEVGREVRLAKEVEEIQNPIYRRREQTVWRNPF
jgi:hypothetical protein